MNTQIALSDDERRRYSRHLLLSGVGEEGVLRLRSARVLVVGCGGLGSPVMLYLAAAGVGTLGMMDADVVDFSNLQRQIIHTTPDVGVSKLHSAAAKVKALNPDVKVCLHETRLTEDNATSLLEPYDFIVDAVDSWSSKLLINDACVAAGKPFCHAGVQGFSGQLMTHLPGRPCLRCWLGDAPTPKAGQATPIPVAGTVVGILGTLQATEVMKFFTGVGTLCTNRLLVVDALTMSFESLSVSPAAHCPACSKHQTVSDCAETETSRG